MQSSTTILDLNIDVLDLIYKELHQLEDKLSFALSHGYLGDAFVHHSRSRYKHISLKSLELENLSGILKLCGSQVLSIEGRNWKESEADFAGQVVQLASDFCPNLKSISTFVTTENFQNIIKNITKIKCLEQISILCYGNKSNIESLSELPELFMELETFILDTDFWTLTFEKYDDSSLDVWELPGDENFDHCRKILGQIERLKVNARTEDIIILSRVCDKLEYLELIDYRDEYHLGIGYFPMLKSLEFNHIATRRSQYGGFHVTSLSRKYNNQLRELTFYRGEITSIKAARRLARIRSLRELNCMKIAPHCIETMASIPLEDLTVSSMGKDDFIRFLIICKTLRAFRMLFRIEPCTEFVNLLLNILDENGVEADKPFVWYIRSSNFVQYNEILDELLKTSGKGNILRFGKFH